MDIDEAFNAIVKISAIDDPGNDIVVKKMQTTDDNKKLLVKTAIYLAVNRAQRINNARDADVQHIGQEKFGNVKSMFNDGMTDMNKVAYLFCMFSENFTKMTCNSCMTYEQAMMSLELIAQMR